jgi:prepilin-type N-terminal cleavage/methylation domain-containing protein
MKTRRNNYGFTLIEMLVVVALVAILASMVIGVASHLDAKAKENSVELLLDGALEEYREFKDRFPEQLEQNFANAAAHSELLYYELNAVPDSASMLEKINNSFIENKYAAAGTTIGTSPEIYDPWKMPLDYRYAPGENFPLMVSAGPDKKFGTADDISNR